MRRREFIIVLGGAMVAWPLPVRAQQPRPLLAILSPARRRRGRLEDRQRAVQAGAGQARLGAGRNIDIVERFADGDASRLPALAAELVSLKPRVLFTNTAHAATVAAEATSYHSDRRRASWRCDSDGIGGRKHREADD